MKKLAAMLEKLKTEKALIVVFFICFVYWVYLFFSSSMSISADAAGYELLGKMIYQKGWVEFFRTGPNREPLYPFSIAMSMRLADALSLSYQKIQTIFQILILFVVQILALKIMTMCMLKNWVKLLTVFYLGFSPAIVNAGFSLFSEILAMPFVLLIVIFTTKFLKNAQAEKKEYIVLPAAGLSFAFVGAIGVKAIFQYIFYFFVIVFLAGAIVAIWQNQRDVAKKIIVGTLMMFFLVGGSVSGYKYMNEIYNGKFDITNRYDYFLFGTAYKRVQPLSKDVWLAHFASIPGNNFCESVVNKAACRYPQFHGSDDIWPAVLPPMLEGVPEKEISSKTIQLSFREIKNNPIQYFFLTFLESLKMGFWESTQIGFVDYPEFLSRIFQNKLFKNGIRLVITLLTYAAFFWAILLLSRSRRKSAEGDMAVNSAYILFCILFIIVTFAGLYSLFPILSRYALPIAPLYVICIAFFLTPLSLEMHTGGLSMYKSKDRIEVTRNAGYPDYFLSKLRCRQANRLIPPQHRRGRILDIGCGTYPLFLLNTKFEYKFGLDQVVTDQFHEKWGGERVVFAKHNLEEKPVMPFADEYFDVITMLAVFDMSKSKNWFFSFERFVVF